VPGRAGHRPDVSVLSTGHDVADARLHRICAALLRRGLSVEVVGLGSAVSGPAGTRVVATGSRPGPLRRMGRAVALPLRANGRVVLTLDPDLVPVAVARGLVSRSATVVDVHEDYAALLQDRDWAQGVVGAGARAVATGSSALARFADVTVVADAHLPPGQARQRIVVRNLPDLSVLPGPSDPDPSPRALYVGDVRRSRGLRTMLEAVEAAPSWTLDVVGPVAGGDTGWLHDWRSRSAAADRVRLHGRLEPERSWALATGAWAGLSLLEDTPAFAEALPTKLYEYLACGLAVLTTPVRRSAELVTSTGAGEVVADARQTAAVLERWVADPADLARCRQAALTWADEHLRGPSPYDELADVVAGLAAARSPAPGGSTP
jgi:glycosyltransferase involved in cell wall biosynthesis